MKFLICNLFLSFYATILGTIIETEHFSDLKNYAAPKTLLILDIDDTLLVPSQTLGTDVWFLYRMQQLENVGMDHVTALNQALAEWEAIRHLTQVQIVEEGTEKIIEELQNNHIPVIGLTTQGLALATRTVQHLHALNIDLTKSAPSDQEYYFMNQHGVLYRQGILFTGGSPKGPALIKLLELMNYQPDHIVFINDKVAHLIDVEKSVIDKNIVFTGLRYNYSDSRVSQFDPHIAEIQWLYSSFYHLLSDEEAQQILYQLSE